MPSTHAPKQYIPIWDALKSKGVCRVACNAGAQRRLIHGIVNVKYYDLAYKLELSSKGKKARLSYTRTSGTVEFHITLSICSKSLTISDI